MALLSAHSSNPLEVPSDDYRNVSFHHEYNQACAHEEDPTSSLDSNTLGYQRHISHVAQLYGTVTPKPSQPTFSHSEMHRYIDLDEDMASESEGLLPEPLHHEDPVPVQQQMGPKLGNDEDAEGEEEGVEEERGQREGHEKGDGGEEDEEEDEEENDEDEDGNADTDEENTIELKTPEERAEILEEIEDLEDAVPDLTEHYRIVDRLGTGTFSSVYKAVDLQYHLWDNDPWHGFHPLNSSAYYQSARHPPGAKVFVAIKRIYVTSSPERIRNEIMILEECRGCRHVSQLITAFREGDQVVAIMPYHRNVDFREYFRSLSMAGIKAYMRCLFRALRDVHARGIIHRDVKPANFLFDPRTGVGTLCDFGLACRMPTSNTEITALGACLHTEPTSQHPHGRIRDRSDYDPESVKKAQRDGRSRSQWASDRVGYPDKDIRPHSKANRAGTRGFRAPEVLFKCNQQTGAIDVWAAGMILLFFLTGKFPIFNSNDDVEALMELGAILGRKQMEKAATLHSRTFVTNSPSITETGMSWRDFIEKQNPDIRLPRPVDPCYYPYYSRNGQLEHTSSFHPPPSSSTSSSPLSSPTSPRTPDTSLPPLDSHLTDLENAYDLLNQLLRPESTHRITPRGVLYHAFLHTKPTPNSPNTSIDSHVNGGEDEAEDDEFVPHPLGSGVCGDHHFKDVVTEEQWVQIIGDDGEPEARRISAGQGVSIGRMPCEFHAEQYGYMNE